MYHQLYYWFCKGTNQVCQDSSQDLLEQKGKDNCTTCIRLCQGLKVTLSVPCYVRCLVRAATLNPAKC
uniref:Uncharacterized protein n=1 Tax=Arundo donax TaxID=35708 RepID=A0A0A9CQK0_ARUDO